MPDSTESEEKQNKDNSQETAKTALQDVSNSPHWRITLTAVLLILLFGTTAVVAFLTEKIRGAKPVNFEECAKTKSSIIQESHPAVCVTKDGLRFVQEIREDDKSLEFKLENEIDTSDWETYHNKEYGYSLKYPYTMVNKASTGGLNLVGTFISGRYFMLKGIGSPPNYQTTWMSAEVFDKNSPNINTFEWILSATGYTEGKDKIPQGDINYAFDKACRGNSDLVATNLNSYLLSSNSDDYKEEVGFSGLRFIYSAFFGKENSPYVISLSLFLPDPSAEYFSDENVKEALENIKMYQQILSTFEFLDENVQGVSTESSYLETEQKMLEEILECEKISEEECLVLKDEFDKCTASCRKELGETECFEICKPVCNTY